MTKELLNITEKNIKYLKTCLDLTESHITWGTKNVREKYSKIKERLSYLLENGIQKFDEWIEKQGI